jgi:hypothetical protein
MRDSFALNNRPYHFFANSSFIAAASSICSANSFFSLPFSSYSDFSRLTSGTDTLNHCYAIICRATHARKLRLPRIKRALRHPVPTAQISTLPPSLMLLQNANYLFIRKS